MIRSWTSASLAVCALLGPLITSAAFADDPPPGPPPDGWSGKGQAGYVMSRGNTDSDSGNAKLDVVDLNGDWKHAFHLEGLYGRSSDIVSAERWAVQFQSNYQFTPRVFAFGAFHYLDDEFSGFEYQGDVSVGAGYKFIDNSSDKLAAQIGAGYRRLRPEILTQNATGAVIARTPEEAEGNAVGTGEVDYEHDFNASTKVTNKYLIASGAGNTSMEDDVALVVNMSKKLALSAGFTYQDNSQPPPGLKKANTLTTLNVVYAFGKQ
jgi:putative salt-induced outer membrane protein